MYHTMATEEIRSRPAAFSDDSGRAEILSQDIQTLRSAFFKKQNVSQVYLPLAIFQVSDEWMETLVCRTIFLIDWN